MSSILKTCYQKYDAVEGEKIECRAEKIVFRDLSGHSGAHRKQGAIIQNGVCWIEKPYRFIGTIKI